MKQKIFVASACLLTLWICSALVLTATPITFSQTRKYKALLVGMDYTMSFQKWFVNATAMKESLLTHPCWMSGGAEIRLLGPKASAKDIVDTLLNMQINANDFFIFYYSGHASIWNGNEKLPALNSREEGLYLTTVSSSYGFGVKDDNLTACLQKANISPSATKIVILDCCYSYGFWNGNDEGDLDKVRNIALLASTREDKTSPASSDFTQALVNGMRKPSLKGKAPADNNPPDNTVTAKEWFDYAKSKVPTGPIYGYRKQDDDPALENETTLTTETWTENDPLALDTDGALNSAVSIEEVGGGIAIQPNKLVLLAPYIGLTSTIMVAAVAVAVCVKRVKRREEKQ